MTIGAGAVAVNSLMAASAEKSIVSLTESQSQRDARFIATLVSQLLADEAPLEGLVPPLQGAPVELKPNPSFSTTTLLLSASAVLEALDIADLAIYNTNGDRLWSSNIQGFTASKLSDDSLAEVMDGRTVSGIANDAVLLPEDPTQAVDVVVTFVPLIGENSGVPVQVLSVSRPVPAGMTALVAESRSTILKTTLISLSGVFLILLAFVLAADIRIWKRNSLALAIEREQQMKLGRRNQELSQLGEARSRFVSGVAHEIKGPLTVLASFLGFVLDNRTGNLTAQQIEQLQVARRNSEQMDRLVSDLTHTSTPGRESLPVTFGVFDIPQIVSEVSESLSYDLNKHQQVLEVDVDPELHMMTADRGRMIQVISNLVVNASKYSPDGTTLRLIARLAGDDLHVEVSDEGIGISEEDQEHIFEMFWRADNAETHNVSGTGIGLGLAKDIVESHGGKIKLSSRLDEGTTVMFDVPLKPAHGVGSETDDGVGHNELEARAA